MCVVMQWQPHLVTGGQHGALMVLPGVCLLLCKVLMYIFYGIFCSQTCSAMDALAQTLMKGAVNCDKHSDLQNSVNQLVVECGIRFWAFPESMSSSLFANCAWACVCASCALIYIYISILMRNVAWNFRTPPALLHVHCLCDGHCCVCH